jgi:hypothetical protein
MVGIVEGSYNSATRSPLGQLHSAFYSLGTRVGEVNRRERRWKVFSQQASVLYLGTLNKLAIHHHVQVLIDLVFDGGYYFGMAVAYVGYRNTADQVDVLFTGRVGEGAAFGRYHFKG